jgi:membrane protein DedA with SNARE-associated domain
MINDLWINGFDGMTAWALVNLNLYGAPALLFLTFIGSLGIPFPVTLVIVAAGALTRQGLLDWRVTLLACLLGAALADNGEYLLGRQARGWLRRFESKPVWHQAHAIIQRQGGWAIALTRFWLTPLAPAINLIAGSKYPYLRFLLFDVLGQLVWVIVYGGLGYIFVSEWLKVSQAVSGFTGVSFALVAAAAGVWFAVKLIRKSRRHAS